eukprot:2341129-Rhodomonas_salina.6
MPLMMMMGQVDSYCVLTMMMSEGRLIVLITMSIFAVLGATLFREVTSSSPTTHFAVSASESWICDELRPHLHGTRTQDHQFADGVMMSGCDWGASS